MNIFHLEWNGKIQWKTINVFGDVLDMQAFIHISYII